jgi:hypothetical protein
MADNHCCCLEENLQKIFKNNTALAVAILHFMEKAGGRGQEAGGNSVGVS